MVLQCRSCGTRMKTRREAAQAARLLCPKCRQPVAPKRDPEAPAGDTPEAEAPAPREINPGKKPEPSARRPEKSAPSPRAGTTLEPVAAAVPEPRDSPPPLADTDAPEFTPTPLPARPAPSADATALPAPGAVRHPSSFQGETSMRAGGASPPRAPAPPAEAARHPSFDGFLPPETPEGDSESNAAAEPAGPRKQRRDSRRKKIERGRRVLDYDELADWDSTDLASMPDAEAGADVWDQPRDTAVSAHESDEQEYTVESIDGDGNKIRRRKKVRRSRTLKGARLFFQRLSTGSRYAVIGLAALTACAGLYGIHVLRQKATDPEPGAPPAEIEIDRSIMTSADFEGAMSAVRSFLTADGVEAKLNFVRQPDRMRPLMESWYRADHSAAPVQCGEAGAMDKIRDRDDFYVLLNVPVLVPDPLAPGSFLETPTYFAVQEIREASKSVYLLDWEVSTGYQEMPLDTFMATMPKEPHIFRVKMREGGYYNHDFTEDKWLCAELYYPGRPDFSLVGYIDRASPNGRALMPFAAGDAKSSLILELAYPENAVSRNQVVITKLIHPSWFFSTAKEAENALTP